MMRYDKERLKAGKLTRLEKVGGYSLLFFSALGFWKFIELVSQFIGGLL